MSQSAKKERVKTPCIGVCSTVYGDVVCRGCKRYTHEVITWNQYSESQKKAVIDRLDQLLAQVVRSKLSVIDKELLAHQLQLNKIPYKPQQDVYSWVYALLRAGASYIQHISDFGLLVHPEYDSMSLLALKELLDKEFYFLSEAHYQRYFINQSTSLV